MDIWNKLTVEVQLKEPNDFKTFFALLLRNSFDAFVWKAVTQSLNKMILITFICEVPNSWENGALRILYFVCPPCYLNKYWKQLDQFFPLCLRNCFFLDSTFGRFVSTHSFSHTTHREEDQSSDSQSWSWCPAGLWYKWHECCTVGWMKKFLSMEILIAVNKM